MKRFFHYPILFLIAILINRIIAVAVQISPVQGVRALIVLLVFASAFSLAVNYRTRDWHRTDFLIALFLAMLLIYQFVYRWIKYQWEESSDLLGLILILVFVWLYVVLTSNKLWLRIRKPVKITAYLNIVFTVLLGLQLLELGMHILPMWLPSKYTQVSAVPPLNEKIHLTSISQPDIYVIVLDGYGRQDVLDEIYGYDNSPFLDQLKQRGFYVADDSHSNYIQTPYAIASLMNFDYLLPFRSNTDYAQYLLDPIQHNRVFQLLDEVGYTTVSFDGTANYTQIQSADVFYSSFLPLNKFETFILTDTPLEPLSNVYQLGLSIPNYVTHRRRVLNKLDAIKTIPESIAGPKITYFHILIPHPPFVFDEDGNSITPDRPYSIMDGDQYAGSTEEYQNGYREQVIFANKRILEAVDAILAKSETPPVVVLMGDHGPASMFKWDLDDPGCVWERTHNLYAVYLPNHQSDGTVYSSITPVNTFRMIFNTYFGTHLPLLDDRTYLAAWQDPSKIVDVTQSRDLKKGCTFSK